MTDSDETTGLQLVAGIRAAFPEAGDTFDSFLVDWEHAESEPLPWALLIERFSQLTTNAIRREDERLATAYLAFMENELQSGTDATKRIIDTYFVESLLWDINDPKIKKWGWSLIPHSLRGMYLALWGSPPVGR